MRKTEKIAEELARILETIKGMPGWASSTEVQKTAGLEQMKFYNFQRGS